MKNMKKTCVALLIFGVAACTSYKIPQEVKTPQNDMTKQEVEADENEALKNEASKNEASENLKMHEIALENLKTRVIAYCHDSEDFSAEECARDMEQRGYVRLTDIPKVTADKDFLTTGTYPTRRWRETDQVPRW